MSTRTWLLRGAAMSVSVTLAACGGGGVNSTPAPPIAATPAPPPPPTPTPPPAPTPTPTPTSTVANDTAEYRATVGAVSMSALSAYNAGATGAGVGLAVIDSGIDLSSAEFEGRLSGASQAFAGNTTIDDEGGHGTAVAFTAAGRRNAAGTHGVAFGATVIALRVDRPGSCATPDTEETEGGCRFGTNAIAQGVDAAGAAGARVVNISLGGSDMPVALQEAIGRATAAGIVVVIAAGNDGTDNPDPFTNVANTPNARGAVIVAGSVGAEGAISSFSDKAGTGAATYLTAVGERVRAPDEAGTPRLWSGTSFAAPQITGAVALLAQAFPNLTGAQIVTLLLTTARDVGAPGTDAIYGRGILDLTRAFQPVGATTVAGATAAVSTGGSNGWTSAPMGDARSAGVGAVILDGFERAFAIDLAQSLTRSGPARALAPALLGNTRQTSIAIGGTAVAMTLAPTRTGAALAATRLTGRDADAARAIAGSVAQRLGSRTSVALGFRQGAAALTAQLGGAAEPAFLVARGDTGFDATATSAAAVRHRLGGWGVTAAAEAGDILSPRDRALPAMRSWQRSPYDRFALALDRRIGPVTATAAMTRMAERDTLLGSRLGPAFGSPGATSWLADVGARFDSGGWTLGGNLRQGWTTAHLHGLTGTGRLRINAWSADIGKAGVFGRDSFGLRIAQPLRVAGGGLDLTLPTLWDYASRSVSTYTTQRLNLAPTGRALDVEARYLFPLAGGAMETNLYWRRDPGNVAAMPDDIGAALRWSRGF
ncbi:S8 family peptidase [Sphingomonas sp.]|jgi:subtilisin family serine protease|uniref:S8 family peptidase n=1 Tax=Sphingomonas sp. TaxID=28214 RepID=UPI002D7ECD7C|nr:S8 family peptidase [Sphingomonas sp.]HEU0045962.1 S8 family peptidase [Sphingomonas sp.]